MRVQCPDWHHGNLLLQGYAEDGVSGTLGYDETTGQWYVDLNDAELAEYDRNLKKHLQSVLHFISQAKWRDGSTRQGCAIVPPKENENRLTLYLIDCDCGTGRAFKINHTINQLLNRGTASLFIASPCSNCGKTLAVLMTWEDVRPKQEEKGGESETMQT